ncbi:MAG: hypothetical protein AAF492_02725 [Verrucomicrobiota bacterium]
MHKPVWWPCLTLVLLGAWLFSFAMASIVPMAWVAKQASYDGQLSEIYLHFLTGSQKTFAVLLIVAGALAIVGREIGGFMQRALLAPGQRAFYLIVFMAATLLTWMIQAILFDGIPHVTDATTHLFQAKLLSMGKLYAPHPRCWQSFHQYWTLITESGRWFSYYPPGHALTFLPALFLGLTSWVCPMATGVVVVTSVSFIDRFYDRATARWSGLLLLTSPLLLLLGASYMSHMTFLMYTLAGIRVGLLGIEREPRSKALLAAAGFLIAMAMLVRPQNIVFLGPTLAVAFLLAPRDVKIKALKAIPWAGLGALPPLLFQAWWNHVLYGTAFTIGYGQAKIDNMTPIMSLSIGFNEAFQLRDAIQQFVVTMNRLNKVLFGWPGSLLLFPLAFLVRRFDRRDVLSGFVIGLVTTFFFFYFYYGLEYEARFFALTIPCFAVLTVRGCFRFNQLFRNSAGAPALLFGLLFALAGHGLFHYWPAYIWPNYAHDYEEASTLIHDKVEEAGLTNALVLIQGSDDRRRFRFTSGFIYNDPLLENDVIYGRDLPLKYECLFTEYADRTIYRFMATDQGWTDGRLEEFTWEDAQKIEFDGEGYMQKTVN